VTGAVGADAEVYGATTISRVTLAAGAEVTLPLVALTPTDGGTGTDAAVVTTAGAVGGDGSAAGVDASPTSPPTRPQGAVGGPPAAAPGGCSCTVGAKHGRREDLAALVLLVAMAAGLLRRSRRTFTISVR